MIKQKQSNFHKPEEGIYGDCHRTAIACLLDLPRDSVPNWVDESGLDGERFYELETTWLQNQGITKFLVAYSFETLTELLEYMGQWFPNLYYILGGTSRNNINHSVIGLGGCIDWDPAIDDSGIIGPMDDGYFWVTVFTKINNLEQKEVSTIESEVSVSDVPYKVPRESIKKEDSK